MTALSHLVSYYVKCLSGTCQVVTLSFVSLKGDGGVVNELTSSEPGELQVIISKCHPQLGFLGMFLMFLARSLVGSSATLVLMEGIRGP